MVFRKKDPVTGEYDPRQNLSGRVPKAEKPSAKKIKEKELVGLLRRLKPNLALAIATVVNTMKNEDATEAGKLKAAALMLTYYKQLIESTYDIDIVPDTDGQGADDVDAAKAPVFSMRVIDKNGNPVDNFE